jgi:hypothetical protein
MNFKGRSFPNCKSALCRIRFGRIPAAVAFSMKFTISTGSRLQIDINRGNKTQISGFQSTFSIKTLFK